MAFVMFVCGFTGASAERIEDVDGVVEGILTVFTCDGATAGNFGGLIWFGKAEVAEAADVAFPITTLLVATTLVPLPEIFDSTRTETLPPAVLVVISMGGWLTPFTVCSMWTFAVAWPFVTFPPEFPPAFAETETLFKTLTSPVFITLTFRAKANAAPNIPHSNNKDVKIFLVIAAAEGRLVR